MQLTWPFWRLVPPILELWPGQVQSKAASRHLSREPPSSSKQQWAPGTLPSSGAAPAVQALPAGPDPPHTHTHTYNLAVSLCRLLPYGRALPLQGQARRHYRSWGQPQGWHAPLLLPFLWGAALPSQAAISSAWGPEDCTPPALGAVSGHLGLPWGPFSASQPALASFPKRCLDSHWAPCDFWPLPGLESGAGSFFGFCFI